MSELTDLLAEELGGTWIEDGSGATCDGVKITYFTDGYRAERGGVWAIAESPQLVKFALYRNATRVEAIEELGGSNE